METKKKKTQVVTTMTDTAKRKSEKKPELTKKNLKESAKEAKLTEKAPEILTQREVKYNYPQDCITPDQRKEFRRKSRAIARRIEKKVHALETSTDPNAKKELKAFTQELQTWKQSTYTHLN